MALPLVKPPPADRIIPLLHDAHTMDGYKEAIQRLTAAFVEEQGRAPHVLVWGDVATALAIMCLHAGASHATVVTQRPEAARAARSALSCHVGQHTVLECSPLQLPSGQTRYDMLVMHAFGSTAEAQGMFGVAWDLQHRRILASFGAADDPHAQDLHYVIPCDATQTVRLYRIPAATVEARVDGVLSIGDVEHCEGEPAARVRWQPAAKAFPGMVLGEDHAEALSDRATVTWSTYDDVDASMESPTHIRLVPQRTDVLVDECFLVMEWLCTLYAGAERDIQVGNLLGLDRRAPPTARRARALHWSQLVAPLSAHQDMVGAVNFAVSFRPGHGDVALTLCDGVPTVIPRKRWTAAQLERLVETTFTRIATRT